MMRKKEPKGPKGSLEERIINFIKKVPRGAVATYGQIAALSGNPTAARQVVRILHSCSSKYRLPWHRIINSKGKISLPRGHGYESQQSLLEKEGILFGKGDLIDLRTFQWNPTSKKKSSGLSSKKRI